MVEKVSVGRGIPGVRFVVLDADISDFDLGQLESALKSALKPLDPAVRLRAVSVSMRETLEDPPRVEVAIETMDHPSESKLPVVQDLSAELRATAAANRITIDPDQCAGRPCLRGLRVRVRDVLDLLAAGADRSEILSDYPMLEDADITAALEYAARQSDHPVLRVA